MKNNSVAAKYSNFLCAVYKGDLATADTVSSYFLSGCEINADKTMCAFSSMVNNNRYYKDLKAKDFVNNNFNNKIKLNI